MYSLHVGHVAFEKTFYILESEPAIAKEVLIIVNTIAVR